MIVEEQLDFSVFEHPYRNDETRAGYDPRVLLIEATRQSFAELDLAKDIFSQAKVTADSGFHSNVVVAAVEATGADAYIADRDYRRREPAFAGAERYKQRDKKERAMQRRRERETRVTTKPKLFTVQDFLYDEANARCICPAGHKLYRSGQNMLFNGYKGWKPGLALVAQVGFSTASLDR